MLPKYSFGNDLSSGIPLDEENPIGYRPQNKFEAAKMFQMEANRENPNFRINTPNINTNKYGEVDPKDLELKGNPQIQEVPQFNNPYVKQKSNTDWSNIATNAAMGLANNAGNIYNLSRYNKPEVESYERAKASYLDPSAAMNDAEAQTRRAEYNVRGASGGNAGTYLSNRVGLNAQNIENKDRIRQQYANANAGIGNTNSQFNSQIQIHERQNNEIGRAHV